MVPPGVQQRPAVRDYQAERVNLQRWAHAGVSLKTIDEWADGTLRSLWGLKAATRALHIASTGCDARVLPPFKGRRPTTVKTQEAGSVPGSPACAENLFDVSQILAWLAKERRDVQEQVEWRSQIPALMAGLELRSRSA